MVSSSTIAAIPGGAGTASPKAYSIAWVKSAEEIAPDLWARCFPPPVEGLWWYRAFERAGVEDQFSFAYAVIARDGIAVGIAPTFQMNLSLDIVLPDEIAPIVRFIGRVIPALRYQRTFFVGSPTSEEGTIGLIPGVALGDVLPALVPAVEARASANRMDMIVWKDVPEAARPDFEAIETSARLFPTPSFPGTEIHSLPANFEGYLKGLSGNHRYQLKKKLKLSRAALDVECAVMQAPDATVQAEIWSLFQQTYERAETRFEQLTPAFFAELALVPSTHFIVLRRRESGKDRGAMVAFMLCYLEAGLATNKFIGLDYTLGDKVFLYFRLFEEFVVWATSAGATRLRSGQTGYRAKFDLEHEPAPLTNFAQHRSKIMHWIYAKVGRSITWSTLDPDLKTYVETRAKKGKVLAQEGVGSETGR